MRVVLQRVSRADVRVQGVLRGSIGPGYLLLVAFAGGDTEESLRWMADKVLSLRLFPGGPAGAAEPQGASLEPSAGETAPKPSSFSATLSQVSGGLLVISQFTLYGDTRKGTRPSFSSAATPDVAVRLYERFVALLRERAPAAVETGEFGAMMEVALVNDGPVTLVLER